MKPQLRQAYLLSCLICLSLILAGCSKEEPVVLPSIQTIALTQITASSATSGGFISDDGGADISSRGVVWSQDPAPTVDQNSGKTTSGTGSGNFTCDINGLSSKTQYYVRAFAVNTAGTAYGNEVSFTTVEPAVVSTLPVLDIRSSYALGGGEILSDGGSSISEKGVCWSTSADPTVSDNKSSDGDGNDAYTSPMTDLVSGTTYYVRAYAVSTAGVAYGEQLSFMALETITDIEGNEYDIVQIGQQTWMAENLRTMTLADGTAIPHVTDRTAWAALTTPAYCWYNNDAQVNGAKYGPLYNWYTVDTENLCPSGWHIPSSSEWDEMLDFLGGAKEARLKIQSTEGWDLNQNGTNESGFRGMPGGQRSYTGDFIGSPAMGDWWTTSQSFSDAYYYSVYILYTEVTRFIGSKAIGCAVRCVKD